MFTRQIVLCANKRIVLFTVKEIGPIAAVVMLLQQPRGRPARLCFEIALFSCSDLHVMARCINNFENSVGGVVDLFCWCVCFFVIVCLIIRFSLADSWQ